MFHPTDGQNLQHDAAAMPSGDGSCSSSAIVLATVLSFLVGWILGVATGSFTAHRRAKRKILSILDFTNTRHGRAIAEVRQNLNDERDAAAARLEETKKRQKMNYLHEKWALLDRELQKKQEEVTELDQLIATLTEQINAMKNQKERRQLEEAESEGEGEGGDGSSNKDQLHQIRWNPNPGGMGSEELQTLTTFLEKTESVVTRMNNRKREAENHIRDINVQLGDIETEMLQLQ